LLVSGSCASIFIFSDQDLIYHGCVLFHPVFCRHSKFYSTSMTGAISLHDHFRKNDNSKILFALFVRVFLMAWTHLAHRAKLQRVLGPESPCPPYQSRLRFAFLPHLDNDTKRWLNIVAHNAKPARMHSRARGYFRSQERGIKDVALLSRRLVLVSPSSESSSGRHRGFSLDLKRPGVETVNAQRPLLQDMAPSRRALGELDRLCGFRSAAVRRPPCSAARPSRRAAHR
jgi:hypothetical protein